MSDMLFPVSAEISEVTMNFYFRNATVNDLPAMVRIYNETVPSRQAAGDLEPIKPESMLAWFHMHDPRSRPIWIAEFASEKIAGWLSFSDFYGRPIYRSTAELSIYVDSAWRRQGLGRQLLTRALECAPSFGVEALLGFVLAHNAPSLKLFYALGFKNWGRLPRVAKLDGIAKDVVIVGRSVG